MPPPAMNFAADVLMAGRTCPDDPALEILGADQVLSHGALLAAVERRAGALAALHLPAGARILLRIGNTAEFPITHLACAAAGLVPVPSSALLNEAEITELAQQIDPSLVVAAQGIACPPQIPSLDPAALDGPPLPWDTWPRGDPERLGYIVFTSGSGGKAKAVAHAHRAVTARRSMWNGWYGLTRADRVLHAGAFNWTYTLGTGLLDPWAAGATALIPAPGTAADALPSLIARHRATILAAAPGIYRRMLRTGFPDAPNLRHGLSAGETLPPATRESWRTATGTDLHEALGLSECSTFISGSPERPAPEGWCGYLQAGRVARVRDGMLEISRKDPGLMLGYWQDGAIDPVAEWFPTGDLVEQDPSSGAIRYLGRLDDQLNPGGHRVSPLEIEAALQGLPVEDLAVGQVTTDAGATILAAYYVGPPLDEAEARAYAAARLARFKQPRLWLRRDALPRNANGKLIRRALA